MGSINFAILVLDSHITKIIKWLLLILPSIMFSEMQE